jgi:SAM-dependent MidA family methyltransferase
MSNGNAALGEIIRAEIRTSGPISFARFMEQALYHPDHGYYATGRAAIGRRGDYFTNVSVGPLFGTLLAAQFIEIWEQLERPSDFVMLEQGAHDGQFAHDVLTAVRDRAPKIFQTLRYQLVEPFPILRERQSKTLRDFRDKVRWQKDVDALDRFVGVHFSNELLDAVPIDLRNKSVGLDGDKFVFVEAADEGRPSNQSQLRWLDQVAVKLQRGFIVVIDYGFTQSNFHDVVQTRSQHRLLDSPFEQIGEADISVHINWTDIAETGEANGLRAAGFTDQYHFFTGIISAWPDLLSAPISNLTALSNQVLDDPRDRKGKRELLTLLHPEMLGRAFQILALSKGVELDQPLAGFRFAREPRSALELK